MKLTDLNKIDVKDLKNIDWGKVKGHLQSQPDLLITIGIAITTVFVVFSTYTGYTDFVKTSKKKTETLQARLKAYEKLLSTQEQQREFLTTIPEAINSNQLIQTFSEFAIKHNIQILSSSPAEKTDNAFIGVTSFQVTVSSERYEDFILFIHDLETSPYPIRLKNWSGELISPIRAILKNPRRKNSPILSSEVQNDYIKATVTIESVELKNV